MCHRAEFVLLLKPSEQTKIFDTRVVTEGRRTCSL